MPRPEDDAICSWGGRPPLPPPSGWEAPREVGALDRLIEMAPWIIIFAAGALFGAAFLRW